jgi:hypothetical protein
MELRLEPVGLKALRNTGRTNRAKGDNPACAEITESVEGMHSDEMWICKFFISDFLLVFGLETKGADKSSAL